MIYDLFCGSKTLFLRRWCVCQTRHYRGIGYVCWGYRCWECILVGTFVGGTVAEKLLLWAQLVRKYCCGYIYCRFGYWKGSFVGTVAEIVFFGYSCWDSSFVSTVAGGTFAEKVLLWVHLLGVQLLRSTIPKKVLSWLQLLGIHGEKVLFEFRCWGYSCWESTFEGTCAGGTLAKKVHLWLQMLEVLLLSKCFCGYTC